MSHAPAPHPACVACGEPAVTYVEDWNDPVCKECRAFWQDEPDWLHLWGKTVVVDMAKAEEFEPLVGRKGIVRWDRPGRRFYVQFYDGGTALHREVFLEEVPTLSADEAMSMLKERIDRG